MGSETSPQSTVHSPRLKTNRTQTRESVEITARGLGLIGVLGGVGGAINAWLCSAIWKAQQPAKDLVDKVHHL